MVVKYLRSINEDFPDYPNRDHFKNLINWEMIQEAKDLSLEYLDKGLLLRIDVFNNRHLLYQEIFSHDKSELVCRWVNNIYKTTAFTYKFYLFDSFLSAVDPNHKGVPSTISLECRDELVEILKEIYPEEIIIPGYQVDEL